MRLNLVYLLVAVIAVISLSQGKIQHLSWWSDIDFVVCTSIFKCSLDAHEKFVRLTLKFDVKIF